MDVFSKILSISLLSAAVLVGQHSAAQTPEEKHALVYEYIDAWNNADVDILEALVHPNFVRHYAGHLPIEGIQALQDLMVAYHTAFSDFSVRVKDRVLAEDRVVVSWEVTGTNDGNLFENPPTQQRARWSGISIVRIVGDKFSEEWVVSDMLEMYRQLGYTLVPPDSEQVTGR